MSARMRGKEGGAPCFPLGCEYGMEVSEPDHPMNATHSQAGAFHRTRWSLVMRAADPQEPAARAALEELCRLYWPPLYCFARRKNLSPADAEDATQSFFAEILRRGTLESADPERGKLRTFLLCAFQRHLVDLLRAATALQRG